MMTASEDRTGRYPVLLPRGRTSLAPESRLHRYAAGAVATAYRAVSEGVRAHRLKHRGAAPDGVTVVSVGNIEVGGNGKTPLAIALVEHLSRRGARPVYVSRGFGGTAERLGAVTVVSSERFEAEPNTRWLTADHPGLDEEVGDEGALVASRVGAVPMFFSRDKRAAVDAALRSVRPTHVVLDDAFQTWRLPRHVDLVLLDAERPFGNGRLLPAGTLRESPAALHRAHAIGFNGPASGAVRNAVLRAAKRDVPVFTVVRRVTWVGEGGMTLDGLERVACVSAIARPQRFEAEVASAGEIGVALRFPDHHRYDANDVQAISRAVTTHGAQRVVTTEKDWVKLARLDGMPPTVVARLEVSVEGCSLEALTKKPQAAPAAS